MIHIYIYIYITPRDILLFINKLNCSNAAGLDGMNYKRMFSCILFVFYLIFYKSIKEGTLPNLLSEIIGIIDNAYACSATSNW